LKTQSLPIDRLLTERLILIPFTIKICRNLLRNNFSDLLKMGLKKGTGWPDDDVIETLPRIINNLSLVQAPTGYESWMIIRKDTSAIIGDAGFKGFNYEDENIDIGYGIIAEERKKGYTTEAVTALIQWAFSNEVVKEITARCTIDNTGSISLLKKMNFAAVKNDGEMIYWSLPKKHSDQGLD
jgi:ribosomal-protein-alanine N-acetyltransferase